MSNHTLSTFFLNYCNEHIYLINNPAPSIIQITSFKDIIAHGKSVNKLYDIISEIETHIKTIERNYKTINTDIFANYLKSLSLNNIVSYEQFLANVSTILKILESPELYCIINNNDYSKLMNFGSLYK